MHYPFRRKGGISMTCTKDYRGHIEYTFHAFCKVVIRNATITAARARSRKYKREISLEYLTEENHYPLSTADKYFQAPEPAEEYTLTLCGIFRPNSVAVARYGALIRAKSPTSCDAHFAEILFQTRSGQEG